ncbi:hypothetical protein BDV95DRAFT_607138 [Massariosphaeria phaeospora]|uniref:Uncharacterized protein n=1 Tax=Massariosphaeria phaeospora TaxID=100035 RepID=A0A7C8I850_9PLEO|nr:hypothetical protein BDV95DRAFT_607138 [Massariosphaeria phaeospora]
MPLPKRPTVPKAGSSQSNSRDSRFTNFGTDPKFRLPSRKQAKTKLDPRFSRLRTDPDFYSKASVDRYGRKIDVDAGKKDIERLYQLDDDDDDDDGEPKAERQETKRRDKAVLKELAKVDKPDYDPIRDGGLSSSSEESSGEEEDEDDEVEAQTELAPQTSEVPMGDVTSRLAVVNMDWDNMRAADIMAVAGSFVPANEELLSVTIYPSEFGMERMQNEELEGPPRTIFASTTQKNKDDITTLAESPDPSDSEEEEEAHKGPTTDDTGEEFDSKALRAYQLERLRYYYAVISCSSPNAAKSIYDNLDGREYLSSANFFDLRFIPDEVSFDEDPRDQCTELSSTYKPNEFTTGALSHSKVELTWDADDTTRKEAQKRAFSRKEIDENELQAYLGSDASSEEDEVETTKTDKAASFRAALGLDAPDKSAQSKSQPSKRHRDFERPEGEMQVTFASGLSTNVKGSVFENTPETTLQKYVRKEKERKAKRKEKAKATKDGGEAAEQPEVAEPEPKPQAETDSGDPWNDPFFDSNPDAAKALEREEKKAKKAKSRAERDAQDQAAAAERAHLELLMADDERSKVQHFDMDDIIKSEKAKNKKRGKKAKTTAPAVVEDSFKINVEDPRFASLYQSHDFAIDPTNPKFKGTDGMKKLLEEGRKKRKRDRDGDGAEGEVKVVKKKERVVEADDLKSLAARVKAKSKAV